jgi:hypothetical protein
MERRTEDAANSLFASLQACSQGDLFMSLMARDPRRGGCIPTPVISFRTALPQNNDSKVLILEHTNFNLWFSIPVSTHAHKHARARKRTNTEAHTYTHTHTHTAWIRRLRYCLRRTLRGETRLKGKEGCGDQDTQQRASAEARDAATGCPGRFVFGVLHGKAPTLCAYSRGGALARVATNFARLPGCDCFRQRHRQQKRKCACLGAGKHRPQQNPQDE